jgi:hypothetical protein
VRLSAQDDFGVPARTLADGRFSTPAAFVCMKRRQRTNDFQDHWGIYEEIINGILGLLIRPQLT